MNINDSAGQMAARKKLEKYDLSIENFIRKDAFSFCREERQYTVFLYNILRKYRKPESRKQERKAREIFIACGLDDNVVIEHVFYEAAFMRDFFERNRRLSLSSEDELPQKLLNKTFSRSEYKVSPADSFNAKLIQYVCEWEKKENEKMETAIEITYSGEERNLGQNEIKFGKLCMNGKEIPYAKRNWIKNRVRWMMNAKPDIAVVYRASEKGKYLLFLECKFESEENSYFDQKKNGKSVRQSEIQWRIADFLSTYYLKKDEIKVAACMEEKKSSRLVKFIRKNKIEEREILIEDLVKMDENI